jgi:hypothetical protein
VENKKEETTMMFTGGMLLAAGATIAVAVLDKTFEEFGVHWLGTAFKIIIPLVGMGLGIYFLETNPIVGWLMR